MSQPQRSEKGQALQQVVSDLTTCFQAFQRKGMSMGSVNKRGESYWGILKLLFEEQAMTVPAIAERRKVSRQRIQVLVDEYVSEGLLAFKDNPQHKRSKLVTLTDKGRDDYLALASSIYGLVEMAASEFEQDDLLVTQAVLSRLQAMLEAS